MKQSIILGIGTGRCGAHSLAKILHQQVDTVCSVDERPFLPWRPAALPNVVTPSPLGPLAENDASSSSTSLPLEETIAARVIRERFARFRLHAKARRLGDCAWSYLPYLEEAIAAEPDIRVVCLRRPREETVASFCEWLDQTMPLPTNHWAKKPAPGWHHDPVLTRTFPQYDTQNREEGIRRYWDEYYHRVAELVAQYPQHVRLFDTYEALNTEAGLGDLLSFVGIPPERQLIPENTRVEAQADRRRRPRRLSDNPMDPRRCVILVPFASSITPPCERALVELERRGYPVRRVGGYAAIDQGRNQMATDALLDGYEETMWIDADVDFHPNAIDRLRAHRLPIVAGIYPQKGKRALASHVMPGASKMAFGKEGGLAEILYAGAGFLLVRREVYLTIQDRLQLPMCNERFHAPMIPFFHPMLRPCEDGCWYLAEDYAFCERARQCGFKVVADTTIRLWHIGIQSYGWEDAGMDRERFDAFTLNFGPRPDPAQAKAGDDNPALVEFARRHAWPSEKPRIPPLAERAGPDSNAQKALSDSLAPMARLVVEIGASIGRFTRYLAGAAPRTTIIAIDSWQGRPQEKADPELAELLPRLYETFLSECWEYRRQIIPVRADSVEGLQRVAEAELEPDLVYVGNHQDGNLRTLVASALDMFPRAIVAGEGFDRPDVQETVKAVATSSGARCETLESGWRIFRATQSAGGEPPAVFIDMRPRTLPDA